MTRINVVPPRELTDKHLIAEYRELPRVFGLAAKWYSRQQDTPIPIAYTLGKGHVAFFYNKLAFLMARYAVLVDEMQSRGFTVNHPQLRVGMTRNSMWGHYTPTREALRINRERIASRLADANARRLSRQPSSEPS